MRRLALALAPLLALHACSCGGDDVIPDDCKDGVPRAACPSPTPSPTPTPTPTPPPGDADCDGIDDDGDGAIDEDFSPRMSNCGVGACASMGTVRCEAGRMVDDCAPLAAAPSDASCDGVDDDCDGVNDEDFAGVPTMCGRDACAAMGRTLCMGGAVVDSCAPGGPDAVPAPRAREDRYSVAVGETLTVRAPGVLGNDGYAGSSTVVAILLQGATTGTVTAFGADGSFSYAAPTRFDPPRLEPSTLWRGPTDITSLAQAVDVDRDGAPDLVFGRFGALRAVSGRTGAILWESDFTDTSSVNIAGCSGAIVGATLATGAVDESGDILAIQPLDCGGADHLVALDATRIRAGRVGPRWVSTRFTRPHPNARATPNDPPPSTPLYPGNISLSSYTEPTLAKLTLGGGTKVLVSSPIQRYAGSYYSGGYNGGGANVGYAACRAATGDPADEGRPCRATWILDATTGAIEDVLTAPNDTDELYVPGWRPWRKHAPIVADLDGDGLVEIISGSDVFRRVGGQWRLAWQTRWLPQTVAVADLDGDGAAEVIQFQTSQNKPAAEAGLFIYRADGSLVRRIPTYPDGSFVGWMSVADADGDGAPDILYGSNGIVFAQRADGRRLWLFAIPDRPEILAGLTPNPVAQWARSGLTAPQIYDLDLDGKPEVVVATSARLYILDGRTGAEKWSIDHEGIPDGVHSLVLADFDDDQHVDIFTGSLDRWNCSVITGGPVPCLGSSMVLRGPPHWAPGPKVFNQLEFRPGAVDDDARVLYDPSTQPDYRVEPQRGEPVDARTRQGALFSYAASACQASSPETNVFVEIRPPNSPPVINSVPPTAFFSTAPYDRPTYRVTATDPDPGDTIHYELVSHTHPIYEGGVTLTSSLTGELSFYVGPCGSFGGPCRFNAPYLVVVAAIDSFGARAEQTFLVGTTYDAAVVPGVVGSTLAEAVNVIHAAGLEARVVLEEANPAPAGTVIAQSPFAMTPGVPLGATMDLTVSTGPIDGLPPPPPGLISMTLGLSATTILADTYLPLTARGTLRDGSSVELTRTVSWSSSDSRVAAVSALGVARGRSAGSAIISARTGTVTAWVMLTVLDRVVGDVEGPVAEITSPSSDARITAPIDVVGTANDPNFHAYELAIAPAGEATFTVIGSGTRPVMSGMLGRLDPTLLLNDQYSLRLTVTDLGGNQTVSQVTVLVDGSMKVGNFALRYSDVSVPMSGLPIEVIRTYDSRDKDVGDFGVGWRLDVKTIRLRTNRVLGTGWVRQAMGPVVSLTATDQHRVTVSLPGGRSEVFDMEVSPTSNLGSLDFTNVTGFTPRPGTLGRLEVLGDTDLLISNAGAEDALVDVRFVVYDPVRFRYTAYDGTQLVIHRLNGVESIRETNGNTLTFGPNGIIHSAGVSVLFQRDSVGRITRIVDPSGARQEYSYDSRGDLTRHSDPEGFATRFDYDEAHRITRITDPLQRVIARTEYDPQGRVTAVTDAAGNRNTVAHDLANRQEVTTNALGNSTVSAYDAEGNIIAQTNAIGATTRMAYDAQGHMTSFIDPLNRRTQYAYDAAGNMTSMTNPAGRTTTMTYDSAGRVQTTIDALGRSQSIARDAQGNPTAMTDALGQVTMLGYTSSGDVNRIQSPAGRITDLRYDSTGNMIGSMTIGGAWLLSDEGAGVHFAPPSMSSSAGRSPPDVAYLS